jgi:transposase InsO family protein
MVKLTDKKIRWSINQVVKKGGDTGRIAMIYGVSRRRIQQLVKTYKETGKYPTLNMKRRPKTYLTDEEKEIIEGAYRESFLGARLLRYHIKKRYGRNISHRKIHEYLLKKGYAKPNPKKQRKRKRCRYERKHSLSLLHGDWFEWNGKHVCGFEDDASRKMLSLTEFTAANGENTLMVFLEAEETAGEYHAPILAVNTDRGTQFHANKQNKKGTSKTRFQKYLESKGIKHIPSRRNNPQTNGKFERWIQEYKKHRHRFNSAEEFMDWYNNRIHGALDLEIGETPNEAFVRRLRPEVLLGLFFRNFEG